MPVVPSWLLEPLWEQFSALLPARPVYHPAHPLGCRRPRMSNGVVFDAPGSSSGCGCSYEAVADRGCSATTIRERRDESIRAGIFAKLKQIALQAYDRIVGLVLQDIAVDGVIAEAPGASECRRSYPGGPRQAGHEALQHHRQLRLPLGQVQAPASRNDSPLLAPLARPVSASSGRCPVTCSSLPGRRVRTRARPAMNWPPAA